MASQLLKEELQTYDFYHKSISLFLRQSFGMEDRCDMYVDILKNILDAGDGIFEKLNIWSVDENGNPNYLETENVSEWLNLIGLFYGLKREIYLTDASDGTNSGVKTLKDYEFLVYIQAQIMKNQFDGTCENLRKIYTGSTIFNFLKYSASMSYEELKQIDPDYRRSYLEGLHIVYLTDSAQSPLTAMIVMQPTSGEEGYGYTGPAGGNIDLLFKNGLLTINSLGISYGYSNTMTTADAVFNTAVFYGLPYSGSTIYTFT